MKADTLTLKSLFQKDVRYEIPTFQRPYVWTQDEQWEPLWDDLRNTAETYLEHLHLLEGDTIRAEERTNRHFLGAVVVQQRPTSAAEIETRLVIDGQQRMTTLQLLLDAAQEALAALGHRPQAHRLARLVLNQDEEGDRRFKVWPTQLDRDAFRAAMTDDVTPLGFERSPIVQAHDFFRLQVREWLSAEEGAEAELRAQALEAALMALLELVVIDLSSGDDAYVIFETLNARGTPLLASDLIKNYVLQQYSTSGRSADGLYDRYWSPLDDRWWREEVRQGRIVRPRIDQFLNYWLVMRSGSEVSPGDVFPAFRAYVESDARSVEAVATDISQVATTYRGLGDYPANDPIGTFLYRLGVLDAGVTTPLVLWILGPASAEIGPERQLRMLRSIESYLVRRMLCRATTKDYNHLFLEALRELQGNSERPADDVLIDFLLSQTAEARLWPKDPAVRAALLDLPLYLLLTRARTRMVLEAIEDDLRSPKTESQFVTKNLSIEHVMPQGWRTHWPLESTQDELAAEQLRERLLHSLGNLTLVTQKLNSGLSNDPWMEKQKTLFDHTTLYLNKELIGRYAAQTFDEKAIRSRGQDLAARVLAIWPRPPKP